MLQQILKDMYIEPELLEELSDEQKQILFFKMREEQIRRWKVREDELELNEKLNPRTKKASSKSVGFFCDDDDKVLVKVISDSDDEVDYSAIRKKQEADTLKKAEEQARKEAETKRKKELEEIEARRITDEKRLREEEERLKKEREKKEAELKKQQEEIALYQSMKEAKLQKEKAELEKIELERKRKEEEEERTKALEEIRKRDEAAKKKQEQDSQELEKKRKEELYEKMRLEQEENRKKEEEEASKLEEEWKEREKKAKVAEEQRRSSFTQSRSEFQRMRKLAQEKAELNKFRKSDAEKESFEKEKVRTVASIALGSTGSHPHASAVPPIGTTSKRNNPLSPSRPPLPLRPTISTPLSVTTSKTGQGGMIPVKREVMRPNRPPPPPQASPNPPTSRVDGKPARPARPKNRMEVAAWWRDSEYNKHSGLDANKKPYAWFHGIISRVDAERLLEPRRKGAFLVRVSERVWGYTVSYKDVARCKHFLIDTSTNGYQFFGTGQRTHSSLNELVEFHKKNPISILGQEVLVTAVGQKNSLPDYKDLFPESVGL